MADEGLQRIGSRIFYGGRLVHLAILFLILSVIGSTLGRQHETFVAPESYLDFFASYALVALCTDVAAAWAAMQAPHRWRQTLWGIGYLAVMTFVGMLVAQSPHPFRPDVFFSIDLPATFLDLMGKVALLKILSLLSGIEITDSHDQRPSATSAWTVGRWLWILMAIAVYVQSSIAQARWYANLVYVPGVTTGSTDSTEDLLVVFFLSKLTDSVVSLLVAGWIVSNYKKRFLLIPFMSLLPYAFKLSGVLIMKVLAVTGHYPDVLFVLYQDAALFGWSNLAMLAFAWFTSLCHIALASLVLWVGCRWKS